MSGLPTVKGFIGETPKLEFQPGVSAPADLVMEVLHEGDGAVVQAGQTIEVNYLGETFKGVEFDSSFRRGEPVEFPIGVGMVIAGWDETLVGRKVGDRVLISIPPHKGYGPNGMPAAGIKGTDTLVFVVDILGVS
jgi:peptidylprolyl isomerase